MLQPWSDGELVEVVVGNQGFEMFTFHVEAPIEDGDPGGEEWCIRTHFIDEHDDPDDPLASAGDYCHGVDVEVVDARMRLGPVLRVLTTKEVRGEALRFAVELSCASFTTVEILNIELF